MLISLNLFAILLPLQSSAACTPAIDVRERAFDCDRNVYYSRESEACVKHFREAIKSESASLSNFLDSHLKIANQRTQKLSANAADASLIKSGGKLASLIAQGMENEAGIKDYLRSLRFPVTWDKSERPPLLSEAIEYFDQEECFGENRRRLLTSLHSLESMLQSLRVAQAQGNQMEKLTEQTALNLRGSSEQARGRARPGENPTPVRRTVSSSTITSRKVLKNETLQ